MNRKIHARPTPQRPDVSSGVGGFSTLMSDGRGNASPGSETNDSYRRTTDQMVRKREDYNPGV
jgi:hypothetical protein